MKHGFHVACAGVRWIVEQAVGGHCSIEAATADPVIDRPLLRFCVDEFDAGPRGQDELVGRLGAIASLVEPVGADVRGEFDLRLASEWVASGVYA